MTDGFLGTFCLGYERGLFLGTTIHVFDGSSLGFSVTPRGGVEGLSEKDRSRLSIVGSRLGSITRRREPDLTDGEMARRFVPAGRSSTLRLGGDTLRFGGELRLGGEALRFGDELRLGGDALRLGDELRLGGDALRLGDELRLGGEALRLGDELRLGGDALRLGDELRLGGDALRFGCELRLGGDALRLDEEPSFGGEALRLEPDRDLLVPLLLLRSLPPPSIEAERCEADTPLS
ncbi:MAG: hypothetical protein V3T84_09785 [Phycisphaerales bacterium]